MLPVTLGAEVLDAAWTNTAIIKDNLRYITIKYLFFECKFNAFYTLFII